MRKTYIGFNCIVRPLKKGIRFLCVFASLRSFLFSCQGLFKFLCVSVSLCSTFSSLLAQNIDADAFFQMGLQQLPALRAAEAKKVSFPWMEEYELRTETDEFSFPEQEYLLRLSPTSPGKRKALKAFSNHLNNAPDFEGMEQRCDIWQSLHRDWLALYIIDQESKLLEALQAIFDDKQAVYSKMAGSYDIDLKDLIDLQTDQSDLKIAVHQIEMDLRLLNTRYGLDQPTYTFEDFLQVDSIAQRLAVLATQTPLPDAEKVYEAEKVQHELAIERAEKRQFFDFAQLRYQGPHTDLPAERFSVGIGLRLPTSGERKLKIQELQLQQAEIALEQKRDVAESQNESQQDIEKILMLLDGYTFFRTTIREERSTLAELGKQIAQQEGFNPLLLLDIEERHIKTQLENLKHQRDILVEYLGYLDRIGSLCASPIVNHLR